jgi:ribonuclease HI
VDRVKEIAEAIAGLSPDEKARLLDLLVARGDLPSRAAVLPSAAEQPTPVSSSSRRPRSPDYVVTFDGGSRGNPGRGYGSYLLVRTQDGAQLLERLEFGDGYTNNEAEYDTLIAALQDLVGRIGKAARQPQEFALEVRGDSALVINQLQGRWQAKEPRMRERRDRCLRLLRRFGAVNLKAQPREESVRVLGH